MSEQRTHDMGGNEAGEVEFTDHDLAPWQKEVFAMRQVLGSPDRQLIRVDELRRAIEDLPEEQYAMAYFDRWALWWSKRACSKTRKSPHGWKRSARPG